MSPRITRSAARLAAEPPPGAPAATPTPPLQSKGSKKRKAPQSEQSTEAALDPAGVGSIRRSKRQKVEKPEVASQNTPAPQVRLAKEKASKMSAAGPSDLPSENDPPPNNQASTSKRKPARSKKTFADTSPSILHAPSRRPKKATKKTDGPAAQASEEAPSAPPTKLSGKKGSRDPKEDGGGLSSKPSNQAEEEDDDEDDGDDPFRDGFLGRGHGSLSSTMRALSGLMSGSGTATRLREILENLRQKGDPSLQMIALGDLSQLLLVSTEDNLSGHFAPDHFVRELVILMQPNELGEENPEMMLLACRCIANLMEALPAATASVVYGGAVPVLCQKLLEIHYIDLAEQALSTLEKISVEFPASIVREGGLTACLTYLEFFATSTQRSAVTTAANCCRNLPEDSFPVVRDVMPILLNVLGSSDQRVVEQASLCVSRIVESFKYQQDKLEELVSPDLLRAILRLLLPGTTNLIGPNIHTQFLCVLAITARASPILATALLNMDVIDTLYQILTGVSPPEDTDDIGSKIDGVVIMQALIHRPREQIYETLNVICELLPGVSINDAPLYDALMGQAWHPTGDFITESASKSRKSSNAKRVELLATSQDKVKRFATILLPTLTHAYSSTVNLSVRQKVLTAQLKMLSNLDKSILESALRTVPFSSFLASILSQQDHAALVLYALQAAELLLSRLESIYGYQFFREGVMTEVLNLASQPLQPPQQKSDKQKTEKLIPGSTETASLEPPGHNEQKIRERSTDISGSEEEEEDDDDDDLEDDDDEEDDDAGEVDDLDDEEDDEDDVEDDGDDDDNLAEVHGDMSRSPSTSSSEQSFPSPTLAQNLNDHVIMRAKKLAMILQDPKSTASREKASRILHDVKSVAKDIRDCYTVGHAQDGSELFETLSKYFSGNALESITSAELLNSEIVDVLLDVFDSKKVSSSMEARSAFLEVFLGSSGGHSQPNSSNNLTSAFSVLVHKLQDLLSRAEHFEVITVHQNSFDNSRSSATSMLAKQLRIKLVADETSDIPKPYRSIMVSIHAIATFKALDDYLRPRISLSERPRSGRHHESISNSLAAFATATGVPSPHQRFLERGGLFGADDSPPPQSNAASSPFLSLASTPADFPKNVRKPWREADIATPPAAPGTALPEPLPAMSNKPLSSRRSSRHHQPSSTDPPPPATQTSNESQDTLECADERQLSDGDELDEPNPLDTFVDDLEGEMDGPPVPDPSAVNMEVASTGKVTAKQEDGTRVPTPSQGASASQVPPPPRVRGNFSTPSAMARALSYAAAIQATPTDWHIEFSIGDQVITNETTIYRAVHFNKAQAEELSLKNVWSSIHAIKFKKVSGPPPPGPTSLMPPPDQSTAPAANLPVSLHKHPETSKILRLLNTLHELNSTIDEILEQRPDHAKIVPEPVTQFVNTKLTAKLNRQLEEPLIVASNCLPSWSEDLTRLYPFLFPFETRHLFLQSTAFGYSRSMSRWQNAQAADDSRRDRHRDDRPFLGRLQRQKVRISRTRILESAVKVMELYGSSQSVLEVEYFEEVGTGLGPTLEFYSTVSKEFSKKKPKLWRENESSLTDEYAFGKSGLFPAPMSAEQAESENGKKVVHMFQMLGKFVARSMLDSRIIDISFNPMFFKFGNYPVSSIPPLGLVRAVDSDLALSLRLIKQFVLAKNMIDESGHHTAAEKVQALRNIEIHGARVEDLGLDFTLPGYPAIELIDNGSNIPVTIENVTRYLEAVIDMTLGSGIEHQITAFRAGFSQVFPYSALKAFTSDELVMLFGRSDEDWTIETLMDSIKADHGFNMDSKSVRNLLQTMSELTPPQRRDFLQFVTGSPKLPIGGFKSLTPMFTVVCKPSEPPFTSDDYLPSVMTCVNYLKLPDYTDLTVMRNRLYTAIKEGQGAFHLS